LTGNQTLTAMVHVEDSGNETFDFVQSFGLEDPPVEVDGEPVTDTANVTVVNETADNETATEDEETTETDTDATETEGEATTETDTEATETETGVTETEETTTEAEQTETETAE